MKNKLILIAALCLVSSVVKAQDTLSYYCAASGGKTVKDSASFLRKTFLFQGLWHVNDFCLDGSIKVTGTYNGSNERIGHFIYYDKTGIKIKEGDYYRNYKIGCWKTWYSGDHIKSIENFSKDSSFIDKILKDGIAIKSFSVDAAMYFSDSKGIYQDTSRWYYLNGNISQEEVWNNTLKFVSVGDENGKITHPKINENDWKSVVFVMPVFTGNLKKIAKENGLMDALQNLCKINDNSFVRFKIDSNGNISELMGSKKISAEEYKKMSLLLSKTKGMWNIGKQHNLVGDFNISFGGSEINGTQVKLKPNPIIYE